MKKPTKQLKEFLENLHFHGYIDCDITKLDNLIEEYYPPLSEQESTEEQTESKAEIVETWEAVYEEEKLEVRDWYYYSQTETSSIYFKGKLTQEKVDKIKEVVCNG